MSDTCHWKLGILLGVLCAVLVGCIDGSLDPSGSASIPSKAAEAPNVFRGPVDKAVCGAGSLPETGLQGRTRSVEDIASGRANLGYQCNMELVGHEGTKALWQMAWYEDCAYYGVSIGSGGVAVVNAKDPANPVRTTTLMTGAMLDPWESLKVNEKRKLLAAVGPSLAGPVAFDVYDISKDCGQPAVTSVLPVNGVGHEGEWAPDGLTYYGSAFSTALITAIDVTNPTTPIPVSEIHVQTHGLSISDDGNRAYLAQNTGSDSKNGLTILDLSQIQSRATNPQVTQLSRLTWTDGGVAQMTIPITVKGKPYVVFIDEGGGVCCGITQQTPGMARIIDIGDETKPFIVSYLRDEIDMTEHAAERATDAGGSGFTYQGHYCGVPQRDDPEVLACSYFWQGIRVFDIRDPYHPKEIAYFVPGDVGAGAAGAKANASSKIRFVKDRGEIWFTDQGHGFMIAKLTNGVWPFTGAGATPATTITAVADQGKFGGAFGLALLLPMLFASRLARKRSGHRSTNGKLNMRQKKILTVLATLCALLLAACETGVNAPAGDSVLAKVANVDSTPATVAVPPAVCGPGSQPETGMQGQVTMSDRQSGRSEKGYWCNLELKGQYQGEGASWQFAWYDDCGYYDTKNSATQQHAGVVVVDASNPEHPVASAFLDSPAMLDPWESLKVNEKRGLLGAVHGAGGALIPGSLGPEFDVYELAGDCKHPKLASTTAFAGTLGHEGTWAPDGLTYYGTNGSGNAIGQLNAIDVTDPVHPQLLLSDRKAVHGLSISDDGNRAYLASTASNGLMIVDTSMIQSRSVTVPLITPISTLSWADGTLGQHSIPVTIKGKPYLIFVDEGGRGAGRIIDISDEANPVVVSKLKLEVHLEQNAGIDVRDTGGGTPLFVYDGHYCGVDQQHEPMVVGCGYFESGIRVFDIRDPLHPKEIAYYNPPAIPKTKVGLGSQHGGGTADHCSAQVRFVKERGELWTTCQDNGFMILKFTNGTWPFKDAGTETLAGLPAATASSLDQSKTGGALGGILLLPLMVVSLFRRSRKFGLAASFIHAKH